MAIVGNFIGGKITHSASNETIPVYDPATGKVIRQLTQSTAVEVEQAIAVAHAASGVVENVAVASCPRDV